MLLCVGDCEGLEVSCGQSPADDCSGDSDYHGVDDADEDGDDDGNGTDHDDDDNADMRGDSRCKAVDADANEVAGDLEGRGGGSGLDSKCAKCRRWRLVVTTCAGSWTNPVSQHGTAEVRPVPE